MPKGLRQLAPAVIDNVLMLCQAGFTEERGKKFEFKTPAMARSTRQSVYEVRRMFAEQRYQEEYKPLFECHMRLDEATLHIGPHPLSFADEVMVSNADGSDRKPFVELSIQLKKRAREYTPIEKPDGVPVDLTLMEKFMLGALQAQADDEVFSERRLQHTGPNRKIIKPISRKRALEYLLQGKKPDRNNYTVKQYYETYAAEFVEAQKGMLTEKSRILHAMLEAEEGPSINDMLKEGHLRLDDVKVIDEEET